MVFNAVTNASHVVKFIAELVRLHTGIGVAEPLHPAPASATGALLAKHVVAVALWVLDFR